MTTIQVTLRMNAQLPYQMHETGAWYNARCDLLKVFAVGKNKRAAIKNLKDSITLLIEGAIEDRIFEEVLSDCGFVREISAGVTVWKAKKSICQKYANQDILGYLATLRPKIEIQQPDLPRGEYRTKIDPVVISAVAGPNAGRISN